MSTVGNCAVIKKEYLVKAIDHQSNDNDDYLEFQTDSNSNNLIASEPPRKKQKKNERGQNKSRAKRNKIRMTLFYVQISVEEKLVNLVINANTNTIFKTT
eukprot:549558_1